MSFEEEVAAGVFVDSICMLCGVHAPPTQTIRTCCERGKQEDLARYPFPQQQSDKPCP